MKIAQICPYDLTVYGGVAFHIASLSEKLIKRGHKVTVFGSATPDKPIVLPDNIPIEVWARPSFKTSFNNASIPITIDLPKILVMLEHIEKEGYDVIHIHEPTAVLFALGSTFFCGLPAVGSWHCYADSFGVTVSSIKLAYKFLNMKKGATLYCETKIQKKMAVSNLAVDTARIIFDGDYEIVPNGVDIENFARKTTKPSCYKDGDINLLFVGRLDDTRKGLPLLLEAYSSLRWIHPNLKLTVVGSGDLSPEAWRVVGEHGLYDVHYTGRINVEELPSYYQHATIFCAPNHGGESFGMVLTEAMASSVAIVASDLDAFKETACGEDTIEFFKTKNVPDLVEKISKLAKSEERRKVLVENAKKTVLRYSWEKIATKIETVYEEAISLYEADKKKLAS